MTWAMRDEETATGRQVDAFGLIDRKVLRNRAHHPVNRAFAALLVEEAERGLAPTLILKFPMDDGANAVCVKAQQVAGADAAEEGGVCDAIGRPLLDVHAVGGIRGLRLG